VGLLPVVLVVKLALPLVVRAELSWAARAERLSVVLPEHPQVVLAAPEADSSARAGPLPFCTGGLIFRLDRL
jgi:hypothetical protein